MFPFKQEYPYGGVAFSGQTAMPPHNGGTIRRMKIGCYYQITFVCVFVLFSG